ncbi:hypothetical protein DPMN_186497 [Dreissena polymorpha]|uniref:Uncharacterized protein n=1 Tax=Dreissena polymorpha TaxID=45954 RepID=A0A9D4DLL3_DREPO|nr:hypothetical protein DPMN_186497 [Dreissena polymorpha]
MSGKSRLPTTPADAIVDKRSRVPSEFKRLGRWVRFLRKIWSKHVCRGSDRLGPYKAFM